MAAVLVLGAGPPQMGFLTAVGAGSVLVFGLVAGVWADRIRRRPILIAADLARAVLLGSIPLAAFAHRLSMIQLYLVIALAGFCTVFFDVAYQSYLPSLVERERLLEGNSKLALSNAIAEIAGPGLTGVLVQLITAPIAILFDALSFLCSALSIWLIRKPEALLTAPPAFHWKHETAAGLRFVFGHPLLRSLACFSVTGFFSFGFIGPLYVLYAIRELRLPPSALGAAIAVGGVGSMLGASLASRAAGRFGLGRTLIGSIAILVIADALIPLAHGSIARALSFLLAQQLAGDAAIAVFNVNELTLRQSVAPDRVLGRVNAAMQLLTLGIYPIGALFCGVVAQAMGVRATLALGVAGLALSSLWLIASPLRKLHAVPVAEVTPEL